MPAETRRLAVITAWLLVLTLMHDVDHLRHKGNEKVLAAGVPCPPCNKDGASRRSSTWLLRSQ